MSTITKPLTNVNERDCRLWPDAVVASHAMLEAEVERLRAELASMRTANIGILRSFSGFILALATTLDEANILVSQKLARYQALGSDEERTP